MASRPELSQNSERQQRFISEAQAAGSLDHPNICTIYEFGKSEDGRLFMVMPYYQGQTLKDQIEQGPVSFEETLRIVTQVAEGLAAAHREGFIYRDIKPANIMIAEILLLRCVRSKRICAHR